MATNDYVPGWVARCPRCPYEGNLESLGWTRIGAYSWGKRRPVHCPQCDRTRWMHIVHVDGNGEPDQSLGKVLVMVFLMQSVIAAAVVGTLMVAGVIPTVW